MVYRAGQDGSLWKFSKVKKRILQINISEYSTERQNQMEISSSHTSLIFPKDVRLQALKGPSRSPPAMEVLEVKSEKKSSLLQSIFSKWSLGPNGSYFISL